MSANPKAVASKVASETTTQASSVPSVPFDPTKAKTVRILTLPLIKLRAGATVYVKVLKAMYQAKDQKNPKPDDNKKPPMLMHVLDLQTGELGQIIPGTILADIFNDDYPSDSYVGKGFKIVVGEQKAVQGGGGKRYNQYTVAEIELPA